MTAPWTTVRERIADRTDRIVAELRAEWGTDRTVEPFELGPRSHDPDDPPTTLRGQLDLCGGIASVIAFYTSAREETVLVYNPSGYWEPPGGVVEAEQTPEAAAKAEAREETGLEVELTDLLYAGRFRFRYESGESAPLPVAQSSGTASAAHSASSARERVIRERRARRDCSTGTPSRRRAEIRARSGSSSRARPTDSDEKKRMPRARRASPLPVVGSFDCYDRNRYISRL